MSIVIAVKVGEGLVLAADSAMSIILPTPEGPARIGNVFNHTRKLLHLKDYPIGILTWGLGTIGPRSLESLVKEFEEQKPAIKDKHSTLYQPEYDYQVQGIAQELYEFINPYYLKIYEHVPEDKRVPVGLYVGGFSREKFFADQYGFLIPFDKAPKNVRPDLPDGSPSFGASWYGLTNSIIRFFKGYDEGVRDYILSKGLPKEETDKVFESVEYSVMFNGMPLQDAIDFAVSLVQMTIARYRFVIGPPVCGGAIDVAVITNRYFNWVQRKSWRI